MVKECKGSYESKLTNFPNFCTSSSALCHHRANKYVHGKWLSLFYKRTYFYFRAADPSNRWKIILQKKMIRFVVKSPLANGKSRAGVLDQFHHFCKFLFFVFAQCPVVFHRSDVQLMFRLGFWRFEGTS